MRISLPEPATDDGVLLDAFQAYLVRRDLTPATVHIGNILDQAQVAGRVFPPEAIAHAPPLLFDHVIVNGTYDFSDAKPLR